MDSQGWRNSGYVLEVERPTAFEDEVERGYEDERIKQDGGHPAQPAPVARGVLRQRSPLPPGLLGELLTVRVAPPAMGGATSRHRAESPFPARDKSGIVPGAERCQIMV